MRWCFVYPLLLGNDAYSGDKCRRFWYARYGGCTRSRSPLRLFFPFATTAHAPKKSFARHWVVERFVDAATLASLHAALCTTQWHAPRWGQAAAAALQGSSASQISVLASDVDAKSRGERTAAPSLHARATDRYPKIAPRAVRGSVTPPMSRKRGGNRSSFVRH